MKIVGAIFEKMKILNKKEKNCDVKLGVKN